MPKLKPDHVRVHRIEFSPVVQREFKQSMDMYQRKMYIENSLSTIKFGVGVAAVGFGVYGAFKLYAAAKGIPETVEEFAETFDDFISGGKTVVNPETGEKEQVGKTVGGGVGQEIENPVVTPVGGGLVYLGMKIGSALNPFGWVTDEHRANLRRNVAEQYDLFLG